MGRRGRNWAWLAVTGMMAAAFLAVPATASAAEPTAGSTAVVASDLDDATTEFDWCWITRACFA